MYPALVTLAFVLLVVATAYYILRFHVVYVRYETEVKLMALADDLKKSADDLAALVPQVSALVSTLKSNQRDPNDVTAADAQAALTSVQASVTGLQAIVTPPPTPSA